MIDRFIEALNREAEMSAVEIADILWLAVQLQESESDSSASSDSFDSSDSSDSSVSSPVEEEKDSDNDTEELKQEQEIAPEEKSQTSDSNKITTDQPSKEKKARIYPRHQGQTSKTDLYFKTPNAPSLRSPLTIAQQAFNPLIRRVPGSTSPILDEVATSQEIADTGLWLPVLRPTLEPWLDLELVVDESISMQIWRQTIIDLKKLLTNYGIFRDVRVWGLIINDREPVQIRRGIGAMAKNRYPRSPKELIDDSGRRLVLVASDCVSPPWRDGKVTEVLQLWAHRLPMAIIQMLPKWLWKRTALGIGTEVRLRGLTPGISNHNLIAEGVSLLSELDEKNGVKVPVFTLEADKAGSWAQMLSGQGSIWTSGVMFELDKTLVNQEDRLFNLDYSKLTAQQRVQTFRVTASPMARKLAGLLAAAPVITLPVVRLIREVLLKDSLQVNMAEVFLGGLLKPVSEVNLETHPDQVLYDFMDGVRELLVDSVPLSYVKDVVDEVSEYVAKKAGLSLESFAAVLRNPQKVWEGEFTDEVRYFATVSPGVLRRLGGEFVQVAEELEANLGSTIQEKLFTFEVVTVDNSDNIINRTQESARQKIENLGNGIKLEMVYIPGGSFLMGSPENEAGRYSSESPQHIITLRPFFMSKYPITQDQYQAIMGNNPSYFKGGNRPVETVHWGDAIQFCRQLSKRTGKGYMLPSESQWEYACRAGTTTPFYFGETITSKLVNYDGDYTYGKAPKGQYRGETTDVGNFPPNSFGLYDMHGNVWEWCQDIWHSNYDGAPVDGSAWVNRGNSTRRVRRGGSWADIPGRCRSALRSLFYSVEAVSGVIGFRLVSVPPRTLE